MRCYFTMRSKADNSQLKLPHGTNNQAKLTTCFDDRQNFISPEFRTKLQRKVPCLQIREFPYNKVNGRPKEASMPKTSSLRTDVSIEHQLVTDRHRAIASTVRVKISESEPMLTYSITKVAVNMVFISVNSVTQWLKCRPDGTIVAKLKYRPDGISLKNLQYRQDGTVAAKL